MLELKDSVATIGSGEVNRANAASVDTNTMFNNAVFGHNATIIVGQNNKQNINTQVSEGNLDQLKNYLKSIGIPDDEISSLQVAVDADIAAGRKPSFEGETGNWFTRLVARAAKGGMSIGLEVVSSTAAKALTLYMMGGAG